MTLIQILIALGCSALIGLIFFIIFIRNANKAYETRFESFQSTYNKRMKGWDLALQEEVFTLWEETDMSIDAILDKVHRKRLKSKK